MNPSCHICHAVSDFLLKKDGFDLYRCRKCSLVFVYPQPTDLFLQRELYSAESGYMGNRARQDLSKDIEAPRVRTVFDYFESHKNGGSMLDVGCGNGQMLYWWQKRGGNGSGVELNKRTADRAKEYGFDVYVGFLKDAPFVKESFDVIFLGEIIEHVTSPREFVAECDAFLKKGGLIGITTPNLDCAWSKTTFKLWQWFGIPWSSVTPPYHLHQFSPHNLDLLMKEFGYTSVHESFSHLPPLKYELGMLHVLKQYKKTRAIKDLLLMLFSYGAYVLVYTVFRLAHPFMKKDFQMMKIYEKTI